MKRLFFIILLINITTTIFAQKNLIIKVNNVDFEMIFVEHGTFVMGATEEQRNDRDIDENPYHTVKLTNDFYIAKYEVTQKLWKAVKGKLPQDMNNLDSKFLGDDLPVVCVSWNDAIDFINDLNQLTGKKFRLPTEAEWEFSARGGNKSQHYKFSGSNKLDEVGWNQNMFEHYSIDCPQKVGTKSPNELGIYDMSGNVWEWCNDWYSSAYYHQTSKKDPKGPSDNENCAFKVYRGGSFHFIERECRVSCRNCDYPKQRSNNLGFRLAL
ncbi:MAG: formylglycine-generating enzyme family protein [Bacteroidales bacterium]|nr:formylglycine-generating enzyme family protein [Bacteroidales bacterium]